MKRFFVLFFVALLFSCSGDNGTNPDSENREIPSYKLFFESSHYNNEFYATGDTIQVVLVDTLGAELPDYVEVVLQSGLGDSESIILKKGGQYTIFFEDSLTGFIISLGSEKSFKRNSVLEINSQKDSISIFCKDYPEIQEIIPIENIKKEVFEVFDDGRMFEFWNGTWYVTWITGGWSRIIPDIIIVSFKKTATKDEIDALNEKYGLTVKSIRKSGTYSLWIPDGTDPVYILIEYLNSDIVEYAELNIEIRVDPC